MSLKTSAEMIVSDLIQEAAEKAVANTDRVGSASYVTDDGKAAVIVIIWADRIEVKFVLDRAESTYYALVTAILAYMQRVTGRTE
jgi:hypothetical protein